MKKTVNILGVAILLTTLWLNPLHAEGLWEVLVSSPGRIESATIGHGGEVCVLEQLRFSRLSPYGAVPFTRELPLNERFFLSAHGSKYASIVYQGEKEMINAARMSMFSSDGRELWSLSHHPLNEVFPLESGGAVAAQRNINMLENQLYFFSPKGKLHKQLAVPALGEVMANSSGDRILVNSGTRGALLFNAVGELLSELGSAYRMSFSSDGRWVALLNGPELRLFYEGKPTYIGELGGEIVRGAAFSPENTLMAAFTDHAFFLMKNPGGKVLLQRQLDARGELSYTSVDLSENGEYIALGIERDLGPDVKGPQRHPEGEVLLYDRDGNILHRMGLKYSHWNTTTPRVRFSADGEQLLVLTRDEVIRATLEDLCRKGGVR